MNIFITVSKVILILILFTISGYTTGYNIGFNEGRKPEERKLFVTSGTRCFSLNENLTATEIKCTEDGNERRK
jgi:hypothetical protein